MKKLLALVFLGLIAWCVIAQEVEVFPQLGISGSVNSIAFSPDSKQILSSSGGEIKLWDTATGRELRTFTNHSANSVAFSPDGRQAVSGSSDNTIKLWDVSTGREIRTFSGHYESVNSIAFSPNGRQIVSGSSDNTIKLWDVSTGREIRTISGHSDDVSSVAFSPDGRQVASGSNDNTIKLWDTSTGREIRTFSGHSDDVSSVAFSPDGRQVLSGSWRSNSIKIWDTSTGREIKTFQDGSSFSSSVLFSPDGRYILSGSKLWDAVSGREIRTFSFDSLGPVRDVKFNHDGSQIIFGLSHLTMILYDTNTGREIRTFSRNVRGAFQISISPDGRQMLSSDGRNTTILWDTVTGRLLRIFPGINPIFNPVNNQIISVSRAIDLQLEEMMNMMGTEESELLTTLWNTTTGREVTSFSEWAAAFSPDGKHIVLLSGEPTNLILRDIDSDRVLRTFSRNAHEWVNSVIFSNNGNYIISSEGITGAEWSVGTVRLWETATGREIRTFSHGENVRAIDISPDDLYIVSGSSDNTIKLWDVSTGREIRSFTGHTAGVESLAFNSSGNQIISGSYDNTIKIWDVSTGRVIRTFSSCSGFYYYNDNQIILSDSTIRLCDISTGKEIAQFIFFIDYEWIVITPDGYYNASPNGDKYLNVRIGNTVTGIDQYRQTFYRPQIVEARLQGRPDPIQVTANIQNAASFTPPVIEIRTPANGATVTTNQIELSVLVRDNNRPNQPIRSIQVLQNGRLVGGETLRSGIRGGIRGGDLEDTEIRLTENQNRFEFRLMLNLDPGINRIEVVARNPYAEGKNSVEVNYRQAAAQQSTRPNLYILSIGVNRYTDSRIDDLNYAVNDAREIINVFKTQERKVFNQVHSRLIADGTEYAPTRENIIDGFDFLKRATSNDYVILFIAGHGTNDSLGNYFFLPSNASFNSDGTLRSSTAIAYSEIQRSMNLPGKKLVFIDTCHSAGVSSGRLIRSLRDNEGTIIFTASRDNEGSQEMSNLRHGAFTYYLIQGMRGAAAQTNTRTIMFKDLEIYVTREVARLTERMQNPSLYTPDRYDDFVISDLR